jgi:hypothetical protein
MREGRKKLPDPDDPVYEAMVLAKLQPYIDAAWKWWNNLDEHVYCTQGVLDLPEPPGFKVKISHKENVGPIDGFRVFPFVSTGYISLPKVAGGMRKMITRIISNGKTVDGMHMISKQNMLGTNQAAQFIAFIPAELYNSKPCGRWAYMSREVMQDFALGKVNDDFRVRCMRWLATGRFDVTPKKSWIYGKK